MVFPLRRAGFAPLDDTFGEVEHLILASFFPDAGEKTIRDLRERSGYSYERVYHALKTLEREGIVVGRRIGKTLSYRINTDKEISQFAFIHFCLIRRLNFSDKHPQVMKALKELINKVDVELAIIFGSYAKGDVRKDSDVDMLCIGGKDVEKTALSLRHRYNLKINPVLVDKTDFKNIKNENPEFWKDLVEFGVILKGYGPFYYFAYR